MSTLALALLLTGAAEGPRRAPPVLMVPVPPMPLMVPPPPLPVPPMPPAPPPQPPVLIRAPQNCFPAPGADGSYDFSECFNGGDYPLAAWQAGEQGTASVRVTLGAHGRPTACEVSVSSGSVVLNRASCDLLRQRILGAYDANYAAVTGIVIAGDVRWVRPEGVPRDDRPDLLTYFSADDYPAAALRANEQGMTGVQVEVGENGRVASCTVTASSGSSALDAATCRIIRARTRFRPARDGAGTPVTGRAYYRVAWRLPEE